MHHYIAILTGIPLKYKMDNSILIVSICIGIIHQNEKDLVVYRLLVYAYFHQKQTPTQHESMAGREQSLFTFSKQTFNDSLDFCNHS